MSKHVGVVMSSDGSRATVPGLGKIKCWTDTFFVFAAYTVGRFHNPLLISNPGAFALIVQFDGGVSGSDSAQNVVLGQKQIRALNANRIWEWNENNVTNYMIACLPLGCTILEISTIFDMCFKYFDNILGLFFIFFENYNNLFLIKLKQSDRCKCLYLLETSFLLLLSYHPRHEAESMRLCFWTAPP